MSGALLGRTAIGNGSPEVLIPSVVRNLLNIQDGANNYVLPTATNNVLGGVKIGAGIDISGGIISSDDWKLISATLTYASADNPTFVVNTSIDLTSKISVGMKLKLTQSTVKYFIVTAIDGYTITLYGGTDYTLTSATITDVYFSSVKAPLGFPLNPNKWSIIITNSDPLEITPSGTTVYNLGGLNITIPIGIWEVSYSVIAQIGNAEVVAGPRFMTVSLSTASNTLIYSNAASLAGGDFKFTRLFIQKAFLLNLASKTTYYLNSRNDGGNGVTIYNLNSEIPCVIKAVCAYL